MDQKTNYMFQKLKYLRIGTYQKKIPQNWYELKSLEVNISGAAKPVEFPHNLFDYYSLQACLNKTPLKN